MFGTKSPFQSLGVLGGAGAMLSGLAGMLGWALTPDDVAQLSQHADQLIGFVNQALILGSGIAATLSGLAALIGRLRAEKKIDLPWARS